MCKFVIIYLIQFCLFIICHASAVCAERETLSLEVDASAKNLSPEDATNLQCLKDSYPDILTLHSDNAGRKWLVFKDGQQVLYDDPEQSQIPGSLDVTVRQSMAQPYPLEPYRPEMPAGTAPGRKRSYALFHVLYGDNAQSIQKNLRVIRVPGGKLRLAAQAADALKKAVPGLQNLYSSDPGMRAWLKPEGGYYWRKIAGESVLSAHSFGIAFDIGIKKAPYWRWSRKMPHPLQKTYPADIVSMLEKEGFIWGGKWHEYDLMHFEYRPELICKARMLGSNSFRDDMQPKSLEHGQIRLQSKTSGRQEIPGH